MIRRTEGHFKGQSGKDLFYQTWLCPEPAATLVVTHGISEHSECYGLFAEGLSHAALDIYAWDLPGHGRSEGKRGLVYDFKEFCCELVVFYHLVQSQKKSSGPIFLLGHSMGGLISLLTLLENPELKPAALCLSSPALGISMAIPFIKEKMVGILGRYLPSLTLKNEVNYGRLSHDPEVLKTYPKDPLRHDKISPCLYLGMVAGFAQAMTQAASLKLPVLLQLAGNELIVSLPESEKFFEKLPHPGKKKIIYKNSYHEIFNDLEREQVYRDLVHFLEPFMRKS